MKKNCIIVMSALLGLFLGGCLLCACKVMRARSNAVTTKLVSTNVSGKHCKQAGGLRKSAASSSVEVNATKGDVNGSGSTQSIAKEGDKDEKDGAVERCEAVIFACKEAFQSEGVQKRLQVLRNDLKEFFVEFAREAATHMNSGEKEIAQEAVCYIESGLHDALDFLGIMRHPALSQVEAGKQGSEFQAKMSQNPVRSANLQAMDAALRKHSEIGDLTFSPEATHVWIEACKEFFGRIKTVFGMQASPDLK